MAINITRTGGNPFVLISRRWVHDSRLSCTALGILAWLSALGPDESTSLDAVFKRGGNVVTGITTALRDLERHGYLVEDDDLGGLVLADPFTTEPRQGDRA